MSINKIYYKDVLINFQNVVPTKIFLLIAFDERIKPSARVQWVQWLHKHHLMHPHQPPECS